MSARTAISQIIERIPNLLSAMVIEQFTREPKQVTHSQERVAATIAALLPDGLKDAGYVIIELTAIEDDDGRRYVRVPVTAQPWTDGEVRISPRGDQLAIVNVPDRLLMQDAPALAAALMAAWTVRARK